jgi:hypothetical protein
VREAQSEATRNLSSKARDFSLRELRRKAAASVYRKNLQDCQIINPSKKTATLKTMTHITPRKQPSGFSASRNESISAAEGQDCSVGMNAGLGEIE